jgi:hypothetical protein
MCRSIKTLRGSEPAASEEEIRAAALQFVRKISGYRVPSRANEPAFDAAVDEIAASSRRLLDGLTASTRPTSTVAGIPRSISKTRSA